jgi:hypothetical protein
MDINVNQTGRANFLPLDGIRCHEERSTKSGRISNHDNTAERIVGKARPNAAHHEPNRRRKKEAIESFPV